MKTLSLISLTLLVTVGCNQESYYEKEYLKGMGVPTSPIENVDVTVPESFQKPEVTFPIHNTDVEDKAISTTGTDVIGTNEIPESQVTINEETPSSNTGTTTEIPAVEPTPVVIVETPVVLPTPEVIAETPVVLPTPEVIVETPVVDSTPEIVLSNASDSFVQSANEQSAVDILWVIDNSGSMQNEQQALAANFNSFISEFLDKNIDFNMGVTTTDARPAKDGRAIYGLDKKLNSAFATSDEAMFIKTFKKVVNVGTQGSGKEMGLNAVKGYLDLYADKFLRADASLAVIILSDEEDQSPLKVEDYINNLAGYKGGSTSKIKLYSIVSLGEPLIQPESIGFRYMEASRLTNGVIASIKDNFNTIMNDFGQIIVKSLRSFTLSKKPFNNEIRVFVDGVERLSGWSYSEVNQSLTFDEGSVPSANSVITVDYKVQ